MQRIGEISYMGNALGIFEHPVPRFQSGVSYLLIDDKDEQWAVITTNLPGVELERGEFTVKTWSENADLRAPLLATGVFVDTGKRVPTGFAEAEVWRRAG